MLKLGYGIKGISGTNFKLGIENDSDAVKFLKETGEEIAYAFLVSSETGEAIDLVLSDNVEDIFGDNL